MNLFISENFIDTVGNKVNVIQLIRHVAEDDEILNVEVMKGLTEVTGYDSIEELGVDIRNGNFTNLAIRDDELYVGGTELCDLFENLYPGDYTSVITSLVSSISNATSPSLRLNHNCTPVVDVTEAIAPGVTLNAPYSQSFIEPVKTNAALVGVDGDRGTFQDLQTEEVQCPEVAVLNSSEILGTLIFNNYPIRVTQPANKYGVLFEVAGLYHSIYGMVYDPEYLRQVIVEFRHAIHPADIHVINGTIYLTIGGLQIVHSRLANIVEWQPLIGTVTNLYATNPHTSWTFDLMGNLVG